MKILKSNVTDNSVIFETEFSSDELKKVENGILTNYARDIKIEGFRKGKAPIEVVKNQISKKELEYRVTTLLANKNIVTIENSEENKKIDAVVSGEWTIEVIKYEPSKEAFINFIFEKYPTINVGDYKKITIPKFDSEVTKEFFDTELEFLLKSMAKDVPFEKDEKISSGDLVSINLTIKAENEKEHKLSKRVFEVKENKSIIDFEKKVIGLKINDKVTYDVVYPNDYFIKEYASKKGKIEIEVLNAYHLVIPELNDELVESLKIKRIKNKKEFLEQFKKDLVQAKLNKYKSEHIDEVYAELIKISEINFYPEMLIDRQVNEMIYGYINELKARKITLNDYLKSKNLTIEKFRNDIFDETKKSFFIQNILSVIAEKEKIEVTEEHIENFFITIAQNERITIEEVKKKTDLEKAKTLILNSLVVDRLVELNNK